MRIPVVLLGIVTVLAVLSLVPRDPPRIVSTVERTASVVVRGRDGLAPRYLLHWSGQDAVAEEVGQVLRDDVAFEGALYLLPAETHQGLEVPAGEGDEVLERWGARGADAVLAVAVGLEGDRIRAETRLYDVATGRLAFAREYLGPAALPRVVAHVIANELHRAQANIEGIAMSRLAFVSDRVGSRLEPTGYTRRVKEIYVADYDGANQRRITFDGDLVLTPGWAPDGSSVAYTSFLGGRQNIVFARPEGGRQGTFNASGKNSLPAFSPDGTRIAFTSSRDGNEEIYTANTDGSAATRLTRHWAIDTSPAWSPDGRQVAFTSSRTGRPQIWVMDADGQNQRQVTDERYCDRPTWSPPPFNEIAYVSRTTTGFDIKVMEMASGVARQLTFGEGFNESPAWAPSGRHLAFTSTRSGTQQIWTMTRMGERLRRVTQAGNNSMPAWSPQAVGP